MAKQANESEVVYGDSVPGFVRSKHGPEVHDVSAPPSGEDLQVLELAVEKLEADNTGIEGGEVSALTEAELLALQVRDKNVNCIFREAGLHCMLHSFFVYAGESGQGTGIANSRTRKGGAVGGLDKRPNVC